MVQGQHPSIEFDVINHQIVLPASGHRTTALEVTFEFAHIFAETELSSDMISGHLSLAHATFAALQGHLRAVVWNMCISPRALLRLLGPAVPDGLCLLGGSPIKRYSDSSQRLNSLDWEQRPGRPEARHAGVISNQFNRSSSPAESLISASREPRHRRTSSERRHDHSQSRSSFDSRSRATSREPLQDHGRSFARPPRPGGSASGADVNLSQWEFDTREALRLACCNGHVDVVRVLLEKANNDTDVGFCLVLASRNGRRAVVQLLLDHEAAREVNGDVSLLPAESTVIY